MRTGVIIVGHTRYKAALKLGLEKVPVHVAAGLTPAQVKAYRIADNQTAALSGWDDDMLPLELAELQEMDFDLDLTASPATSCSGCWSRGPTRAWPTPTTCPSRPTRPPRSRATCGCSASTACSAATRSKPEDVDRLLDGAPIHLVNTRPALQRQGRAALATTPSPPASAPSPDTATAPRAGPGPPPGEGQADRQEAAGQGPAAGQRLRLRRGVRPAAATPGSATWPACCCQDAASTSGAATPTSATTRRS